jgi:cytosine/adenosine deaminase-related metal-dependent hydrolase
MKTVIRDGLVIAFDGERHVAVPGGDVVYEDDAILHAGGRYSGLVDRVIDATGGLVSPGLVNTHCHVTDTPFTQGWLEDHGARDLNNLYRILPAIRGAIGAEDEVIAAECSFIELLSHGTTTVFEMGYDFELMEGGQIETTRRIADLAGRLGIRAYIAPRYRSGYWRLASQGTVEYGWYADRARLRFEDCVRFVREFPDRQGPRVLPALAPGQVDTCEPELLEATRLAADALRVPVQLHAGQSPHEFREITRRHGQTTISYLAAAKLLAPDLILGHGIYLTEDGRVDSIPPDELGLLISTGTSIAHCPVVKARQGTLMNSFTKYRRHGINVSLGTDTFPLDMLNEMRFAATICKIAESDPQAGTAREVFDAATLGGARALGRDDLGRLAPGCKADIVIFNLRVPQAVPMRDPIKHLVFNASAADVATVVVDGQIVVERGRVLNADVEAVVRQMEEAGRRVWKRVEA